MIDSPASVQAMRVRSHVNASGESDAAATLAQLAGARYVSDPPGEAAPGTPATPRRRGAPTLTVFTSLDETRAAVNEVAASAQRLISIYTPDLEPELYDTSAFLEIAKRFVLSRSFAKIRVLIWQPTRLMRESNRFIAMGRRLSSYIDLRYAEGAAPQRPSAYLIADDRAIAYRMRSDSWDGIVDIDNPAVSRLHLGEFDAIWAESEPGFNLRIASRE
ncbi:MAG: hypothetical protein ACRETT_02275 [Steroidobacteraceae bacterium]